MSLGAWMPSDWPLYCSASARPNISAAQRHPNGFQRPAVTIASAMKPRPAVVLGINVLLAPTESDAPATPAIAPPKSAAAVLIHSTFKPAASAAAGSSPHA